MPVKSLKEGFWWARPCHRYENLSYLLQQLKKATAMLRSQQYQEFFNLNDVKIKEDKLEMIRISQFDFT